MGFLKISGPSLCKITQWRCILDRTFKKSYSKRPKITQISFWFSRLPQELRDMIVKEFYESFLPKRLDYAAHLKVQRQLAPYTFSKTVVEKIQATRPAFRP